MDKATVVFVLGAPGAGKGTQCKRIVERYGWTHLSTGDLLRAEVARGSELGQELSEIMKAGEMVPTELALELLANALAESGSDRFLIDGFPRKLEQLLDFQQQIKQADGVLVFSVPEEVAVERLLARGATSGRADDNEDTVRQRMEVFRAESQPVIDYLADQGANLHEVDASGSEEEVWAAVAPFMDALDAIATEKQEGKSDLPDPAPGATGISPASDDEQQPQGEDSQGPADQQGEQQAQQQEGEEDEADQAQQLPHAQPDPDAPSAGSAAVGAAEELRDSLVVFVLGAPGSGKGTQCTLIRERFGWQHLSTGDLLRQELDSGSELGQQVSAIMASGQMVPTPLVLDLLLGAMLSTPPPRRFLVDGFPRQLEQLQEFEAAIKQADGVLVFSVPEEVAVERLLARGATSGRADDNEDTIRQRMEVFRAESQPVIDYLQEAGADVAVIDASGDVEEIFAQAAAFLDRFDPPPPGAPDTTEQEPPDQEQQQEQQQEGAEYTLEQIEALTKIQAAGRGMLDRRRVAGMKAQHQKELEGAAAAADAQEQAQEQNEEEEPEGGPGADEGYTDEQVQAVTRIQAARRGQLDRQRVAAMRQEQQQQQREEAQEQVAQPDPESLEEGQVSGQQEAWDAEGEMEYTPEQVEAVTRIQAAGRGMLDRRRVAAIKAERQQQGEELAADAEQEGQEGQQEAGEEAEQAAEQEHRPSSALGAEAGAVPSLAGAAAGASGTSPEDVDAAVVRIQAAGRGYLDRKRVAALKAEQRAETEARLAEQVEAIRGMLVVCGPSGVGKGTLISRLMSEHPDKFGFSVSHTTRAPRPGEEDGVHYHFSDRATMQTAIAQGAFLEFADVHGNMYGTSLEAVAAVGRSGRIAVLDIDVQGAQEVKASLAASKARFVFIDPPSHDQLEARLRGRGTETEDKIQLRLANATSEIEKSRQPGFFDARVVNDDLEAAFARFKSTIERLLPGTFSPADLRPPSAAARTPTPPSEPRVATPPSNPRVPTPPTEARVGTPPAPQRLATPPTATPPAFHTSRSASTVGSPPVPSPPPPAPLATAAPVPPRAPVPASAAAGLPVRQYMDATVVPVLRDALRALNEARPTDPLKFVADYLYTAHANGGKHPQAAAVAKGGVGLY